MCGGGGGASSPADFCMVTLEQDLRGTALLKPDRHLPVHGTEPSFLMRLIDPATYCSIGNFGSMIILAQQV